MKSVRIVNDGKPGWATQITDAETGEPIPYVMKVTVTFDANRKEVPMALIYAGFPAVDVTLGAEIRHVCPHCGKTQEAE